MPYIGSVHRDVDPINLKLVVTTNSHRAVKAREQNCQCENVYNEMQYNLSKYVHIQSSQLIYIGST